MAHPVQSLVSMVRLLTTPSEAAQIIAEKASVALAPRSPHHRQVAECTTGLWGASWTPGSGRGRPVARLWSQVPGWQVAAARAAEGFTRGAHRHVLPGGLQVAVSPIVHRAGLISVLVPAPMSPRARVGTVLFTSARVT